MQNSLNGHATVSIKDIQSRIGASDDMLRNQFGSITGVVEHGSLLAFLEKKAVAGGAWSQDKAQLATAWLNEIKGADAKIEADAKDEIKKAMDAVVEQRKKNDVLQAENARLKSEAHSLKSDSQALHLANVEIMRLNEALNEYTESGGVTQSKAFLFNVLVITIIAQMLHTCAFAYNMFPLKDYNLIRLVTAVVTAFAVDLTGFIATIWLRKIWMLRGFSVAHFAVNLTVHAHFATPEKLQDARFWGDAVLLSALLAFALYVYSEIFITQKKAKNE